MLSLHAPSAVRRPSWTRAARAAADGACGARGAVRPGWGGMIAVSCNREPGRVCTGRARHRRR